MERRRKEGGRKGRKKRKQRSPSVKCLLLLSSFHPEGPLPLLLPPFFDPSSLVVGRLRCKSRGEEEATDDDEPSWSWVAQRRIRKRKGLGRKERNVKGGAEREWGWGTSFLLELPPSVWRLPAKGGGGGLWLPIMTRMPACGLLHSSQRK